MTTMMTRKGLGWLLAGAAFVSIVATPGCARRAAPAPRVSSACAEGPTPGDDDAAIARPRTVNVFGELDGVTRPVTARPVGDWGFQQHTFADEGADSDVSVDPAGKWLVFTSTRHGEHPEIYVQRVDGTSVTQLTSDGTDDAYPTFSPDGKRIAFCSTRAGSWQIYTMDTDGRNVTQVTNGAMQCVHPSFSPDGGRLVYSSLGSRSRQWELWTADLRTGEKKMIGYGLFPAWSPDRSVDRIAFQRARQRGSRWFSLWTLDLIDGEGRRLTEVAVSSNAALVSPKWSPDGQRISFATIAEPARAAGGKPKGQQDIWTIDADGSDRQRLTDGNGTNLMPFWSADGRVYFISDRGGSEAVWSVRADRGQVQTAGTDHAPAGDATAGPARDAHGAAPANRSESADTRDAAGH